MMQKNKDFDFIIKTEFKSIDTNIIVIGLSKCL